MTIPLLFLPGLLCDQGLWRAQIDGLSGIAASTVADLTKDDSIAGMATRALAAAPPTFALCALSMGGYVAFEIMRQAPDRVTHLALLDTSAKPDDEERKARRRALMDLAQRGKFKGVTPKLLPSLLHPDHLAGPAAAEVLAMAERVGKDAFLYQQTAIMNRADSRPTLSQIKVPTLVGVGDADAITPRPEAEEMHAAVKGSSFHIFGHSGHLTAMERPGEVTAVLRGWLQAEAEPR